MCHAAAVKLGTQKRTHRTAERIPYYIQFPLIRTRTMVYKILKEIPFIVYHPMVLESSNAIIRFLISEIFAHIEHVCQITRNVPNLRYR